MDRLVFSEVSLAMEESQHRKGCLTLSWPATRGLLSPFSISGFSLAMEEPQHCGVCLTLLGHYRGGPIGMIGIF